MPKLGEIRRSEEIGYGGRGQKYTWCACMDCGKQRWVALHKGEPVSKRCSPCANKLLPHPSSPRIRIGRAVVLSKVIILG